MLSDDARRFLDGQRVGRLATAGRSGTPHVVPVCFAIAGDTLYVTVDAKPKREGTLKRISNIRENPAAAFIADRYEEDWSRLAWVMLHGRAEILEAGEEHDEAQSLLRRRYPQLQRMQIDGLPVIALRIARSTSWGKLAPDVAS
jgi:PPOX class probable F420-dependent enzyme